MREHSTISDCACFRIDSRNSRDALENAAARTIAVYKYAISMRNPLRMQHIDAHRYFERRLYAHKYT